MGPLNAIRVSSVHIGYSSPYGKCKEFSVCCAHVCVQIYGAQNLIVIHPFLVPISYIFIERYRTCADFRTESLRGDGRVGIPDAKNSDGVRTFAEPDIRGCIRQRARVFRPLPRPPWDNASGINCAQTVPLIIRARPANNNSDTNNTATRVYRVCAWTVVRQWRVECRRRMSKTVTIHRLAVTNRDIGI